MFMKIGPRKKHRMKMRERSHDLENKLTISYMCNVYSQQYKRLVIMVSLNMFLVEVFLVLSGGFFCFWFWAVVHNSFHTCLFFQETFGLQFVVIASHHFAKVQPKLPHNWEEAKSHHPSSPDTHYIDWCVRVMNHIPPIMISQFCCM